MIKFDSVNLCFDLGLTSLLYIKPLLGAFLIFIGAKVEIIYLSYLNS